MISGNKIIKNKGLLIKNICFVEIHIPLEKLPL